MKMVSVFSRKAENTGRQTELDLLRGFTVLNIINCHVGLYLGSASNTGLYVFCDISGSEFAAPILMALMGINMHYSRHQSPAEMLKRGICLFFLGYGISAFRSILPLLLLGPVDEWASVPAFFVVDILQFAGLSFMFTALLKKLELPDWVILVISLVMVFVDQFIMLPENVSWNSELLTGIVNLFCPVSEWSCFPFMTWFFFPAFGLVAGNLLTHCINKKRLYCILLPAGLLGVLYVYSQFYLLYPDYPSFYWGNNFYYMGVKNVLLTCCFICFSMAFWFFVQKILPSAVRKFLAFLSKQLNTIYIISWILISMLIHYRAIAGWELSAPATLLLTVVLSILCVVLAYLWCKYKKARAEKKP